jgi:5'-nucleotidase
MLRLRNKRVAVLLAVVLAVTMAVGPAAAVAKPDILKGVPYGGPKASATVGLQLLAINDFHGQLPTYSATLGGAAVLGAYLDKFEAEAAAIGAQTMRLGVGDLIGASPAVSGLLQDEPTMKVLDMLDFEYSTVGNHEFDEGIDELYRLQYGGYHPLTGDWGGTTMKYLAANVVFSDTGETVFRPYVVKRIGGIPVGFIGIGYENTPSIVTAAGTAGLTFLPEAETVNKYVKKLKQRGVEAIVVLMHDGGSGKADGSGPITGSIVPIIDAMDDEVDVVMTAHSHAEYWGTVDGKLVTQAYSAGRAVADVDLVLDRATGDVISKTARIVRTLRPQSWLVPDAEVAQYVADTEAFLAPIINRVVATAATDITRTQNAAGESALGKLIADAQAWKMGTPLAFMNPGGIRADLLAGEVTWGELFAIQPFSNNLVSLDLKGSDIELALEQQWLGGNAGASAKVLQISGISYTWDSVAPAGSRVDPANIMVGAVPIDLAATYRVTMNSFLADGGDNFAAFKAGTNRVVGGFDLDGLVDYVIQLPQPFSAPAGGRITKL